MGPNAIDRMQDTEICREKGCISVFGQKSESIIE